ncbi:MAG: hypothetical protein QM784_36345 [Polyangiaceae bacterium]
MQFRPLLAASTLGFVASFAFACSSTKYPNAMLTFTQGQEDDTFDGVEEFEIRRVHGEKSEKLLRAKELPESIDLGKTGVYQYVGIGFDADGNRIAEGRTLYASPGDLVGAEIPMFFARTDRATRPSGAFALSPKQNPLAAVFGDSHVWLFDDSSEDTMETDTYTISYWEQSTPPTAYESIACTKVPCNLRNLMVVGSVNAVVIAEKWAFFISGTNQWGSKYELPDDLDAWTDVTGGRVLPGGNSSAILFGPTRLDEATDKILALDGYASPTVFSLKTKRAGAAVAFEDGVGMVLVGGSAEGAGVEQMRSDDDAFVELPYPADPVVGAALVVEDETHLLRMGGLTPDGTAAPTVRIDLECTENCAYEPVADLNVELRTAQSYFDPITSHTLVVGEDADGVTEVYRYFDGQMITVEIPTEQKRVHALALELPNQQLGLIGGTEPGDESQSRSALSVIAF